MSGIIGSVGAKALMKTEVVVLTTATHLQAKDEDATDSTNITTQAYVEKYSAVITPTAWMIANGKKAVLVVEYIIKTDPGVGTVTVQTLVDGADAVEKTLLNIAAGKQTAVHTDILAVALAAGTSYTVSLEAKNSDAAQTSVIDYCNIYLQIGTSSLVSVEICRITGKSLNFQVGHLEVQSWSGAVDNVSLKIRPDWIWDNILKSGTTVTIRYATANEAQHCNFIVNDYAPVLLTATNADNPGIVTDFNYSRVWLE